MSSKPNLGVGISKEDVTKRAIEDYSQFSQHVRGVIQYAFAANGGAAAAMMSFMTALATSTRAESRASLADLIGYLSGAAGFYLLGVMVALLSLVMLAWAKKSWGDFWEEMANMAHRGLVTPDFRNEYAVQGTKLDRLGGRLIVIACLLFVPGSIVAIFGFLHAL